MNSKIYKQVKPGVRASSLIPTNIIYMKLKLILNLPVAGKEIYKNLQEVKAEFEANEAYLTGQIEGELRARWVNPTVPITQDEISILPFDDITIGDGYTAYPSIITLWGERKAVCTVTKECKISGHRKPFTATRIYTIRQQETEIVFFTNRFRSKLLKKHGKELGLMLLENQMADNLFSYIAPMPECNAYCWTFNCGIAIGHWTDGCLLFDNLKSVNMVNRIAAWLESQKGSQNP